MPDPADNPPPPPPPPDKPAPPARTGPQPMWMSAGGPAPVGKNKALFVGLLLIMLVAGTLVGILLLPSPPVSAYIVSLPLPLYNDPSLPPVPWAEQDTKLLVECFPENAENAYNAQELDPLRGKLKAIGDGKLRADWGDDERRKLEKGRPFIFHIVGHAATANDKLFLLPVKADASDPQTWLALDDILKAMADCPTPKKLLLLDLGKPRTNAALGPLQDDVTPKLHEWLNKKRSELPCPVMVSCSPGEESFVIPQVGTSVFAYYVAEGLRGAADGYGTPDRDKKVKVRELAEFVKIRVARWARQNRDLPQIAKIFEPSEFTDFDLMLDVPDPIVEDPEPKKNLFARIGLAESWTQRAAMTPAEVRRAGPHLTQWASAAMRAEQIFGATANDARTAEAANLAKEWWNEVARAARPPDVLAYRSLAAVPLPAATPMADPTAAVRAAIVRYAATALPESGTKIDEKDLMIRREEMNKAAADLPGPVVARILWDWLLKEYAQPKATHIAFVSDLMATALRGNSDLFVEVAALGVVRKQDSAPYDKAEARGTLMKFLRTEAAASAALNRGSVGFAWVAPLVAAADEAKLKAEQLLVGAKSRADVEAADKALQIVLDSFVEIEDRLIALAAARNTVEDAMRLSAGTAVAVAEHGWPATKDWTDLTANAGLLADMIFRKPNADWKPNELKTQTKLTGELAAKLAKEFEPAALKTLIDSAAAARPSALVAYQAILQTPLLVGPDRGKVWDALDAIGERLHTETRKNGDLSENASRTPTKMPTLPPGLSNARGRRADVGIRLLELGGHPAAKKLRADFAALTSAESAEKWTALATELRTAWGRDGLTKWMKTAADKGEWDTLDRLVRALPIGLWQGNPDKPTVTDWRVAPAKRLVADEAAYREWLAGHYRKYATARTDVTGAATAYQKAAQEADRRPRD